MYTCISSAGRPHSDGINASKQMQLRCSLRSGAPRLTVLQIKQTKGSEMFKKTLAAAALLGAFAGSAVAADVTLYGVVDLSLIHI